METIHNSSQNLSYTGITVLCPLCESEERLFITSRIGRCLHCGLLYTYLRLVPKEQELLYRKNYILEAHRA